MTHATGATVGNSTWSGIRTLILKTNRYSSVEASMRTRARVLAHVTFRSVVGDFISYIFASARNRLITTRRTLHIINIIQKP